MNPVVPMDLLFIDETLKGIGESPYILFLIAVGLSILTAHFIISAFRKDDSPTPRQHEDEGMIICPSCGKPTETEYRFCRFCASDTGKGYVDLVDKDDSSRSGMF